jgi:DNA polymerase-3 subunit delta
VQRHFLRLHRYRAAMEGGRSLDELLRQARPPIHFKVRPQLEAQCRSWNLGRLSEALALIATAAKSARLSPWLEGSIAERLILDLATLAPPTPRR